jgi:hypothetical protein
MKNIMKLMVVAFLAVMAGMSARATSDFPDPTTIYSALDTPFVASLTWVIGAIGVLAVIGWILKAVRRK